ncbi:MAG: transketolase C-terminal domain-containing protein, partial [Bryobacteraceae bacterium]
TGLTHDERGYPSMNAAAQDKLIGRLREKILRAADRLTMVEEEAVEDADVVVISYGITSRVAQKAIETARQRGVKVGKCRLIGVWPFPDEHIRKLAGNAKALVVPEINCGQIVREVQRVASGGARVVGVSHAGGGVHRPEDILKAILEAAQ